MLAGPIAAETGWPLPIVVGGVSVGLLTAGIVSPRVGRLIGEHGGRPVLAASALLFAAGLTLIAISQNLMVYAAGWLALGCGMGCGLYDASFATLGRLYGAQARRSIGMLTLFGGFASTFCWPLSAFLSGLVGWRGTCLIYAGLHLGLALPVYLWLVPNLRPRSKLAALDAIMAEPPGPRLKRPLATMVVLGAVMALCLGIGSAISVHLLTILKDRELDAGAAVALAGLIGPSQVGARIVELSLGQRHHPMWTMVVAVGMIAAGLSLLFGDTLVTGLALILYGAGNGIYSIARGALPLVLFGPARYPALIGKLALPALIVSAVSPSVAAMLIGKGGAALLLGALLAMALVNVALVAALVSLSRRRIMAA